MAKEIDIMKELYERAKPRAMHLYGSAGRPWALIGWCNDIHPIQLQFDPYGQIFWETLREHWAGFDKIPHDHFQHWMAVFRNKWIPSAEVKALKDEIEIFRGQDASADPGLSWTLDIKVARMFAKGHRLIHNRNPTVLRAIVDREDVAMVINDRDESEIVLFEPPSNEEEYE